jgi:hypothetical protein
VGLDFNERVLDEAGFEDYFTAAPLEIEILPQKMTTLADLRPEGSGNESQDNTNSQPREADAQSLERADGGLSAWKVLLGAFTFEAILWGKPSIVIL